MRACFVETMRGWIKDGAGVNHPVSFRVKIEGSVPGRAEVTGLVFAPPWADEAPVRGIFTVAPFIDSIRYELFFKTPSGSELVLEGEKKPWSIRLVRGLTTMKTRLSTPAGQELASGTMQFALRDLPVFVASWLPRPQTQQRRLDAQRHAVERRALGSAH